MNDNLILLSEMVQNFEILEKQFEELFKTRICINSEMKIYIMSQFYSLKNLIKNFKTDLEIIEKSRSKQVKLF